MRPPVRTPISAKLENHPLCMFPLQIAPKNQRSKTNIKTRIKDHYKNWTTLWNVPVSTSPPFSYPFLVLLAQLLHRNSNFCAIPLPQFHVTHCHADELGFHRKLSSVITPHSAKGRLWLGLQLGSGSAANPASGSTGNSGSEVSASGCGCCV